MAAGSAGHARAAQGVGGILSYFARHRTAANLVLLLMMALGAAALPRMRAQFFPDVVIERVNVSVTWDGAGAEDVDNAIIQLLEPTLLAVEGVDKTNSVSFEGRGTISLEFEPGTDMGRATEEVRAAIETVADLPEDADPPEVRRAVWRDRVTDIVITGPVSVDQLAIFADELTARLFRAGVTRVSVRGVAAPQMVVEVSEDELTRHGLTLAQIAQAIRAQSDTAPAGEVAASAKRVRTGTERHSTDRIRDVVLRTNSDGSRLTVGDVASIRVEGIDRERAYFVGDQSAVSLRVDRSDQGDAIALQQTVQQVVDEMNLTLPEGVQARLVRKRADAISQRLALLLDNGAVGMVLVLILLFLFLNARTAFWVAAGIPASMIAAIGFMYLAGITLNMVSLFALIITLGMVVDDAIVVGEHADFRARRLGEPAVHAAENAVRRMAAPVFSATITTVIAFFALVVIGGRFGTLIADIPLTVVAVLMASLLECFLVLPNHMAHSLSRAARGHWYDWPNRLFNRVFGWFRDRLFRPFVGLVVRFRYPVLAGTCLILATQVALFLDGHVRWRFFNAPERGAVSANFAMLPGATRQDTLEMMRELQRATTALGARLEAEYGRNPLDFVMAQVGGTTGRGLAGADIKDKDQLGGIDIELIDPDDRPYSSFRFIAMLEEEVQPHPMMETLSFRGHRSGPGGDALDVEFFGADARTLKRAAEALKAAVLAFPEVSAVEDNLAYDKQELALDLTPRGQALGFRIDEVGRVLRNRLNGIVATSYPDGARSADIRVQLPAEELTDDFLMRTMMRTPAGALVPLSDIVTMQETQGFATVRREDGLRVVTVTGDISEDDPVRAAEISAALKERILPAIARDFGVDYRIAGLSEQESAFLDDAKLGFILCLAGIYLVLAWIFASWTRPIVVMAIIPFGLVGTIWGHQAWGVPLSMFTVVGLIGMTGIIINDSIVLVSTVDEYASSRGLVPAIVDATADRLRPVLLTTLTTVLGLAPLLYERSTQAQFLKPTVITLSYGLGFGMLLVLLVVPSLMAIQQDLGRMGRALRRALSLRRAARGASLGIAAAALAILAGFAGLFGPVALSGGLPSALVGIPVASALPPGLAALSLFILWSAAVCALAYAVIGALHALTARRRLRQS